MLGAVAQAHPPLANFAGADARGSTGAFDWPIRPRPAWLGMTLPGNRALHGSGKLAFAGAVFLVANRMPPRRPRGHLSNRPASRRQRRLDCWRTRRCCKNGRPCIQR